MMSVLVSAALVLGAVCPCPPMTSGGARSQPACCAAEVGRIGAAVTGCCADRAVPAPAPATTTVTGPAPSAPSPLAGFPVLAPPPGVGPRALTPLTVPSSPPVLRI
jgi:hypothetical protein